MARARKQTNKKTEESIIEERVDAMMAARANSVLDNGGAEANNRVLPPLDIYAQPTSAPPLSDELLEANKEAVAVHVDESKPTPVPKKAAAIRRAPTTKRHIEVVEEVKQSESNSIPVDSIEIKPLNIDTPQSDAAIDDIVAQEADVVLAAEDAHIAADTMRVHNQDTAASEKSGHPVFWFFIFMLAVLCIVVAVLLVNPNVSLPFSA